MANTKYLDYAGLQRLVENLNEKFAPIQAIVFKTTVEDISSLPALNTVKAGYMYNIKTGGITTADFVEGEGHIVADGENIAAVELFTGEYIEQTLAADADPKALGLYVLTATYKDVTNTLEPTANPKALGLYEEDNLQYALTNDTAIISGKHYYQQVLTYTLTEDRLPVIGTTYFKAETVKKWDLMGGVFDLEDRYLEFGDTFPQTPPSKMVDNRTFLYMGDSTKVYTKVASPEGRPTENNYFEVDTATPVIDTTTIYNPKQQQLYEKDETGTVFYILSTDVTYDSGKTYYSVTFEASADTSVDPTKIYYTEAEQYRKGGIYHYDATAKDWILQSGGGSGGADIESIPIRDIDDLFI